MDTPNEFLFSEQLAFSKGIVAGTCTETIKNMIPGCVQVVMADEDMDRTGVDYIATLRRGATIYVDHKTRLPGCRKFWKRGADGEPEPELALEKWSVKPTAGKAGVVGWTLDEAKMTHYTLHTFDTRDSNQAYLLPFQLLRKAFCTNCREWFSTYEHATQHSARGASKWQSECVFVPVGVVFDAVAAAMTGHVSVIDAA